MCCLRTLLTPPFEERRLVLRSGFSGDAPQSPGRAGGLTRASPPQAMVDTGKTMKALLKHVETFEPKMVKVAG